MHVEHLNTQEMRRTANAVCLNKIPFQWAGHLAERQKISLQSTRSETLNLASSKSIRAVGVPAFFGVKLIGNGCLAGAAYLPAATFFACAVGAANWTGNNVFW